MCSVCAGISKVNIHTLCDNHYWEWCAEKVYADLDRDEEYFHLV